MHRRLSLPVLVATLTALTACSQAEKATTQVQAAAQAQATPTLSTADAAFLDQASRAGIEEVTFGQLAREKGARASTRDFALHMIDAHTAANQQLTQLAASKQIAPPTTMDTAHTQSFTQLESLKGRAFDRAYLNGQAADHTAVLQLFQDEATNGTDPEVRAFAARLAPDIQQHLRRAAALGGNPRAVPPA